MSQWQGGYYQPNNPQFQQQQPTFIGQNAPGLIPQPTGFPGQRFQQQPQQPQLPQQTGFIQSQPTGFVQPQVTGYPGPASNFQVRQAPPVPPLPTQYAHLGQPQVNRFQTASPGIGITAGIGGPIGSPQGLLPQPTGFPGQGGPGGPRSAGLGPPTSLMPQVTGYVDPRLQMMSSTFMPAPGSFSQPGLPQLSLQQPQFNLQQSIAAHNQSQTGRPTQQMAWALTKAEKKQYNDIFRNWDAQGTGFVSGQTALEVFGASGLGKEELAKIWTLADIDDRGKLNIAEFHVAMGLIYRRLSGMPIPDQLPHELVPPSARDLNSSVDMVRDLLKHETRSASSRSPSSLDPHSPVSLAKVRSFNDSGSGVDPSRDATVYRHNDEGASIYKPRTRHLNRDDVRGSAEEGSPTSDLEEMKRRLKNTAEMLDRAAEIDMSRTREDDELDRELEDLKLRVKRVSEDLEYVSRAGGPRTPARDGEKRKLERELMELMHERLPAVERRIKDREERKERDRKDWARERDRRNGKSRFEDDEWDRNRDRDRQYEREKYRDRDDDDRSYSRHLKSRSRERSAERDRERDREHERERDRPRSPPPASYAPAPSAPRVAPPVPPPASPGPTQNVKKLTPEERLAFARAEAQRRIEERKAALGITATSSPLSSSSTAPSSTGPPAAIVDTTVEDRLQRDKIEAEEKAKRAEKMAEERERARKERVESERAGIGGGVSPKTTSAPTATATNPAPSPPVKVPTTSKRPPVPPPPRKTPAISKPAVAPTPPVPVPPPAKVEPAPEPQEDPEEAALRVRAEAIRKQQNARAERLRLLEKEEEEAREEEERLKERERAIRERGKATPSPAPVQTRVPTPPPPPVTVAPPAPTVDVVNASKSTNPFSQFMNKDKPSSGPASAPPSNGNTNPWASASATPRTISTSSPAPSANTKTHYHTAPSSSIDADDDWDVIKEKSDDDDSSDEEDLGRGQRKDLAMQLFGSMLPSSRPQSAAANPNVNAKSSSSAAPPPVAPTPPPAPRIPTLPSTSGTESGPGNRSNLMQSIQGGLKLRSVKTVDKSGPPVSGRVLGDSAPPAHISVHASEHVSPPPAPSPASVPVLSPPPTHTPEEYEHMLQGGAQELDRTVEDKRQSVGWFAERAADAGTGIGLADEVHRLPSMREEDEEDVPAPVPTIHIDEAQEAAFDPLADIDRSIEHRVRSLYAYQGDGPDDLSFAENLIMKANPSKSGGDWWYGTFVSSEKSGLFPKTYVSIIKPSKARALYSYTGDNPDELPFTEGDELTIIDKSEEEWWKTEQGGVVFIVPAAYLEAVEDPRPSNVDRVQVSATETKEFITSPTTEVPSSEPLIETTGFSRVVADPMLVSGSLDRVESPSEDDDGASDSSSDYFSFDGSGDEDEDGDGYPELKAEREARAYERQLVLRAAGLIVKQDERRPPPRPPRSGLAKRRPPPAAPNKRKVSEPKALPPTPEPEPEPEPIDHATRLDDAFDRYEAFKNSQANRMSIASSIDTSHTSNANRMSIASVETLSLSPTASTLSVKEGEGGRSYTNFLHFLRSKTPEAENPPKRTLNISAPVLIQSPSQGIPSRSESPAFGTSWASLVDKTALEGIPPGERRRQEAIFELINTEAAYVRDLQLIVEKFYSSMVPLLSTKEITVIFANVEDILLVNTAFLSSLEERQKDYRLYMDHVGDILMNHIPNMNIYMSYCVNQSTAIKVLKSLRDSKPELEAHLQRLRDEDPTIRNLDLSSYLLVPMQRITRYPLLLKQILSHTETELERDSLQNSIEVAEHVLDQINETIRDQEGRERLKVISQYLWIGQGRLDLTAPTRYMGSRKLIKEGPLTKAKSGRKLHAFLCSDILVLTDQSMKSLYRMPIPLAQAQVKEAGRDDLTFQVAQAYPRGGDAIGLKTSSARDCQLWIQEIDRAGRRCRHAEEKSIRKQRHQ